MLRAQPAPIAYNIQSIVKNVNNGELLKYFPDKNLSKEQLETKMYALIEEAEYDYRHKRISTEQKNEKISELQNKYKLQNRNNTVCIVILQVWSIVKPYGTNAEQLTNKTLECIDTLYNKGYNTVVIKNYWLDEKNPYNGINTTIQAPNGQKFEMQYHTQESFDLKNGKMHELYEKQRVISDKDSEEYLKLQDEMFDLAKTLDVPKNIKEIKTCAKK